MREVNWDQCMAYAVDDDDKTVVVCNLKAHCDVSDDTAEHYDERLGIRWRYSED